jgi:hypothetical protein
VPKISHLRNGPLVHVAICGYRVTGAPTDDLIRCERTQVTCPQCIERVKKYFNKPDRFDKSRAAREKARKEYWKRLPPQ